MLKNTMLIALASLALNGALRTQDKAPPQARPEVGKPAPTARLNDYKGNIVALGGKQKNWSLIAFFPKAATPG